MYRKEGPVIRNYTHMLEKYDFNKSRDFSEQSSYHLKQRLGRATTAGSKLRMPPMKKGFISKAALDRKYETTHVSTPQQKKGNFFGATTKTISQTISNGNGSSNGQIGNGHEARGTNTLSYSETMGQQTASGFGKKGDASEVNTVFGTTFKGNQTYLHPDQDELRESANFGVNQDPTKDMLSSYPHYAKRSSQEEAGSIVEENNSMAKSDYIDKSMVETDYASKIDRIPELRCNWFQFYTDVVFCAASSLVLVIDDIEYNVPFGLAKGLLASKKNLENFIRKTTFSKQGSVNVDAAFVQQIKGTRIEKDSFVTQDDLDVDGVQVKLM